MRKTGDGLELLVDASEIEHLVEKSTNAADERRKTAESQKTEAAKNYAFFCAEVASLTWVFLSYTFFIFELWT